MAHDPTPLDDLATLVAADQPQAAAALHLAAALLRGDPGQAHYLQTILLNSIAVEELLSAAVLKLELASAANHPRVAQAAAKIHEAALLYESSHERRN